MPLLILCLYDERAVIILTGGSDYTHAESMYHEISNLQDCDYAKTGDFAGTLRVSRESFKAPQIPCCNH